jgi:hypothetical protein
MATGEFCDTDALRMLQDQRQRGGSMRRWKMILLVVVSFGFAMLAAPRLSYAIAPSASRVAAPAADPATSVGIDLDAREAAHPELAGFVAGRAQVVYITPAAVIVALLVLILLILLLR